jgi:hypothetical protein
MVRILLIEQIVVMLIDFSNPRAEDHYIQVIMNEAFVRVTA